MGYNFNTFCELLNVFDNVSDLTLAEIHLTDFDDENKYFDSMLPKLNTLKCGGLGLNESANLLRNKLMAVYSKQLISIGYNEEHKEIDTYSFDKLEKLSIYCTNDQSLKNIINSTQNLKHLELYDVEQSEAMKESMIKSLSTVNFVSFSALENTMETILRYVEIGLLEARELQRKSLRIEICLNPNDRTTVSIKDVELFMNRLVNALDASNTDDFMLSFYFDPSFDSQKYSQEIVKKLQTTHSVFHENVIEYDNEKVKIVISNRYCKMSGSYEKIIDG